MQYSQFNSLKEEGFNHIPLSREVVVDTDTPLALYLKLANTPFTYFLESVQGGEKWGRYSFIGLGAEVAEGKGSRVRVALNDVRAVFHRPHPQRVTNKASVRSVQRFLIESGVTP